jgi:hypothetical protein
MMENSRGRKSFGSLMKAGFPTLCGQCVKGDSMPIAASATCYDPTPCAPWPALRRQEVGCLRQGSGAVLTIDLMKKELRPA